ncbi:GntR family transcriptional repressor for pyruvate dehydrogenase complex [Deinobacterium chartae]|uniref:GntR family transcriptional repressor for pyruvate dehydrogenase complex n=1 Tax=Deinobacterium chartae TaxID=521158 RepID=A0A841I5S5_9DEIO|nr:FadR/GntR family transcriptional regulator [Deinobacterium chartae]MBB6099798.1 GntR family transcriptional repressor for pyruvate dehydrogenase complex [Deinobacterium chartae]
MPTAIRRVKVSDSVTSSLLDLIRHGDYPAGTRLPPERELAVRFGVSRATLRDALRRLELLGYLEVRQGGGTFARTPDASTLSRPFQGLLAGSPGTATDLMEFRCMVEPEVAALAAERASSNELALLSDSYERQQRAADRGLRLADEDMRFHGLIAQASGNAVFSGVLETLRHLMQELRHNLLPGSRPDLTLREHLRILEAITARDPHGARAAMAAHLNTVSRTLRLERALPGAALPTLGDDHD